MSIPLLVVTGRMVLTRLSLGHLLRLLVALAFLAGAGVPASIASVGPVQTQNPTEEDTDGANEKSEAVFLHAESRRPNRSRAVILPSSDGRSRTLLLSCCLQTASPAAALNNGLGTFYRC